MGSCASDSTAGRALSLLCASYYGDRASVPASDEDTRLALRPFLQASAVAFVIFIALWLFT